jgi:hypothetical protein
VPEAPAAPRQPSRAEVLFAHFLEQRDLRIWDLTEHEAPPDEKYNPGWINATIGGWLEYFRDLEAPTRSVRNWSGPESGVALLMSDYLELAWPADCKRRVDGKDTDEPQPYPFRVLSSEKVWKKLAESIRGDLAEPAGGVH